VSVADPNGFNSGNAEENKDVQAGAVKIAWIPTAASLPPPGTALGPTPFSAFKALLCSKTTYCIQVVVFSQSIDGDMDDFKFHVAHLHLNA